MANTQQAPPSVEGNDAVCFTAGPEGAAFGAGTIHAYLAADRKPPAVVAGISLGAVTAAAMQRAYRLLHQTPATNRSEREAARWRWFREYLQTLTDQPLNIIWNGIPDQSDFFADMEPIRDTSIPPSLAPDETAARRKLYLLVKLGRWLARFPVSVKLIADLLVGHVRSREKYPPLQRLSSRFRLIWSIILMVTQVILHACASPEFFPEHRFRRQASAETGRPKPAMHLLSWLNSITLCSAVFLTLGILGYSFWQEGSAEALPGNLIILGALLSLGAVTARMRRRLMQLMFINKRLLPLLGYVVYGFSWINLVCLSMFSIGGLWLGVQLAESMTPSATAERLFLFGGVFLVVISFPILPLLAIPEIRRWLVDQGLLKGFPRPLFGWSVFVLLWTNLIGLVSYLVLSAFIAYSAMGQKSWFEIAGLFLILTPSILFLPLVPMLPILGLTSLRRRLRLFGLIRPGFTGMLVKLGFWTLSIAVVGLGFWLYYNFLLIIGGHIPGPEGRALRIEFYVFATVLSLTWFAMAAPILYPWYGRWWAARISSHLGLSRSLIHDFHLRWKLTQLFDPNPRGAGRKEGPAFSVLDDKPMPIVVVAAPLQTMYRDERPIYASQLWAKRGTPLVQALRTAIAIPPLFEPTHLRSAHELGQWLEGTVLKQCLKKNLALDLVDGAVVRQNPLPALFSFLRREPHLAARLAKHNSEQQPAVHVVYRVPINEKTDDTTSSVDEKFTIVDVGLLSIRLSERCDTQLEVEQSNFISRFASHTKDGSHADGPPDGHRTYSIFADEIAPENDLVATNPLDPGRDAILKSVAEGCRGTLQTIYRTQLQSLPGTDSDIECGEFLKQITNGARNIAAAAPGLPEVCSLCTRRLKRPHAPGAKPASTRGATARSLGDQLQFVSRHEGLSGKTPRIAFVASGGVFRGAFHIGMLGALGSCNIKPDLVVGASVGTLMCGALGAMFCTGPEVLGRLVDAFLRVDEEVALTKTLKAAARELGLRGRCIDLSPRQIRRMVRRGSRSDPGYAALGAPPAVVDAISDLFMIPSAETARIAAKFIAGHVTDATHEFLSQIKRETLRRLDIKYAVIGVSLLERLVKEILAADSVPQGARQPFMAKGIAYFGTTTNLKTQTALLLGGYGLHEDAPYDYVEAALASSAFPAVFAPRPESSVFPGAGRPDILFADGGMFDNLPFLPAIQVLSWAQRGYRLSAYESELTALDFLKRRHEKPDLIIAGALNTAPETDPMGAGPFDSLSSMKNRAKSLAHNVKIRGFESSSMAIHRLVGEFLEDPDPAAASTAHHFVDTVVDAAVLSVFPASIDHLNPTFAFCASTGLQQRRVLRSIANGCFETLREFAEKQAEKPNEQSFAGKAIQGLGKRIPKLTARSKRESPGSGECPYFNREGAPLRCPFAAEATVSAHPKAHGVYTSCKRDFVHWGKIERKMGTIRD